MLSVQCIDRMDKLRDLQSQWVAWERGRWMRSFDWLTTWYEHFCPHGAMRALVAKRSERPIALLPLCQEYRLLTGRTLRLAGSGLACSDDLGFLCSESDEEEASAAFAHYLIQTPDCPWDYLDWDGVRELDVGVANFGNLIRKEYRLPTEWRHGPSCWKLNIDRYDSGEVRWPKRLRCLMHRGQRERVAGSIEVRTANTLEEAKEMFDTIERMHQARWTRRGESGCFSDPAFRQHLWTYTEATWHARTPWISVLQLHGAASAGAIAFRHGLTLSVYLTSMEDAFAGEKPGWKLHGALVDAAARAGCTEVDYLRGDEVYKRRLGAVPSEQGRLLIAAPGLQGQVRHAIYETARDLRNYWRVPMTH